MTVSTNYLLDQYEATRQLPISHNYLREQFADYREIFREIETLVQNCDYTLGRAVLEFEAHMKELTGARYAIGLGSGTDAIFLSLKVLGVGSGDQVITTPYTFFATVGAIGTTGATPVFVDVREDYTIDPELIERAITPKTKAIVPVHWSGLSCDMDRIMAIAARHDLAVVEDACHAINAQYRGKSPGRFGDAGCFSLHPLKNLNVWGDGGYVITDSQELNDQLLLLRNHGLINREEQAVFGFNSRLDTIQAIVANHLFKRIDHITDSRIGNAQYYDGELSHIPQIIVPKRDPDIKQVFHIYVIRAEKRDELQAFLISKGIDAKVHYPMPMHLQPAVRSLGYRQGDFPVAEKICSSVISLPVHEFLTREQLEYTVAQIGGFYA